MSVRDIPPDEVPSGDGSRTGPAGTPFAVDVSRDRRARFALAMFVAGPVIWSVHFLLVYLVTEAGCTGDGPGLTLFDPPMPKAVTLAATAAAAAAALACAGWSWRRWQAGGSVLAADEAADLAGGLQDRERGGTLAFAGFLLSLLSVVTILFVGLPALVLPSC
jgi:NO-binding membrane sensor protein with MHYT domain